MLKHNKKKVIISAAVIGLLVFFHFVGVLRPAETMLQRALNPVFGGLYRLSAYMRTAYDVQTDKEDLRAKTAVLEERIVRLTEENARFRIMEDENKTLREHLRFLTKSEHNYLLANVISRGDPTDFTQKSQIIVIDKGSRDGLYPGLAVVTGRGVLIGKISEVKDGISEAILSNNPSCKLAATVLNEDKTAGVAEGDLGLTIKMSFTPHDIEVKSGDTVVTSGLEQLIPRGLVIGNVVDVSQGSNDLWQTSTIEPLEDPDLLTVVSVILPVRE